MSSNIDFGSFLLHLSDPYYTHVHIWDKDIWWDNADKLQLAVKSEYVGIAAGTYSSGNGFSMQINSRIPEPLIDDLIEYMKGLSFRLIDDVLWSKIDHPPYPFQGHVELHKKYIEFVYNDFKEDEEQQNEVE